MMDLETVDLLLTTTRSVRKRLDLARPVEPEVIARCIEIAMQAPTGSNRQSWHFLVVTDPELRLGLADLYRKSFEPYAAASQPKPGQDSAVRESAIYLAEHMHEVPVLILACIDGRVEQKGQMAQAALYGSILPAAWSLMLALRARGLGSAWTTLHLAYEREAAQLLGIPEHVTQSVLLPVAYFTGETFKPAKRLNPGDKIYWDRWGNTTGGT